MVKNEKLLELLKTSDLVKLESLLMDNIREEAAKNGIGNKKQLTIIKSMLQAVKNNSNMQKTHDFNGLYAFVDGYRILATENNYGYEASENPFIIDRIIVEKREDMQEIKIDLAALATFTKTHNKKDKKPYIIKFDNNYIAINAWYLKDSLQFTNSDSIFINPVNFKRNKYIAPIYFYSNDNGDMSIVLPVKIEISENMEISQVVEVNQAAKQEIEKKEAEKMQALHDEVYQENEMLIAENKKEFIRIYNLIYKELHKNKILFHVNHDKKIELIEKYDGFISIYEDFTSGFINEFKKYDHINYKLKCYGYNYMGLWDDEKNDFIYREYKVKNHLYYKIAMYAREAIEIFLSNILELKENITISA